MQGGGGEGREVPHKPACREPRLLLATYSLHCSPSRLTDHLPPLPLPCPPGLPGRAATAAGVSLRNVNDAPFLPGLGIDISWRGPRKLPAVSRLPTRPHAHPPRSHLGGGNTSGRRGPAFCSGGLSDGAGNRTGPPPAADRARLPAPAVSGGEAMGCPIEVTPHVQGPQSSRERPCDREAPRESTRGCLCP